MARQKVFDNLHAQSKQRLEAQERMRSEQRLKEEQEAMKACTFKPDLQKTKNLQNKLGSKLFKQIDYSDANSNS